MACLTRTCRDAFEAAITITCYMKTAGSEDGFSVTEYLDDYYRVFAQRVNNRGRMTYRVDFALTRR